MIPITDKQLELWREIDLLVGFWVVDRDASSTLEVSTDVKTYNGWIKDATGTQPADIKETEGSSPFRCRKAFNERTTFRRCISKVNVRYASTSLAFPLYTV